VFRGPYPVIRVPLSVTRIPWHITQYALRNNMTSLTLSDVEKIAHLARLALTAEEKQQYLGQLQAILDYAAMLNELDLEDVLPSPHAVAQQNVLRDDVIEPSLPIEDTLHNAPQQAENQFLIQSVLDD